MSKFMLNRKVITSKTYAERSCLLVQYQLPFLQHCFILCHDPVSGELYRSTSELMSFFFLEAQRLAFESVGDSEAFMLIHSGSSIRKRSNWHLHVFVVQYRWQKAWVYSVLGIKNIALAVLSLFMNTKVQQT